MDASAKKDAFYEQGIDIRSKNYKHENLNKLTDVELAQRKRAMDRDFDRNNLKPGDPGFVYDKVVNFERDGSEQYSDDWDD